jgi:hypothetical protein
VSRIYEREGAETKPTFDLLPLRVEGLACFLGLSPQVTDHRLLLLEGLAQVLMRDAELDQLPVELRGLVFPLLERRLCPLEFPVGHGGVMV